MAVNVKEFCIPNFGSLFALSISIYWNKRAIKRITQSKMVEAFCAYRQRLLIR